MSEPATTGNTTPDTANTTSAASSATASATAAATTDQASASSSPAAAGDWMSSLSPELKNFAHAKQFKDPGMVVDSYKNLEKLMGAPKDRLLKLPEDPAAAEWETIYQRLGKPEKADGYKVEVPKELGLDEGFVKFAKDMFHKANLTTAQAEAVLNEWTSKSMADLTAARAAQEAQMQQEFDGLKSKWGNAYEQKLSIAQAGAREAGLSAEQIDSIQNALGYTKTMELFSNIGSKLGEASFTAGANKGFGAMSPETARMELANLKADSAFMQKYVSGDAAAKAKMNKVMADAYPGEIMI